MKSRLFIARDPDSAARIVHIFRAPDLATAIAGWWGPLAWQKRGVFQWWELPADTEGTDGWIKPGDDVPREQWPAWEAKRDAEILAAGAREIPRADVTAASRDAFYISEGVAP